MLEEQISSQNLLVAQSALKSARSVLSDKEATLQNLYARITRTASLGETIDPREQALSSELAGHLLQEARLAKTQADDKTEALLDTANEHMRRSKKLDALHSRIVQDERAMMHAATTWSPSGRNHRS